MISRAEGLRTPQLKPLKPKASIPLSPAQKREVDEAFAIFDYARTGVLNLHEVKRALLHTTSPEEGYAPLVFARQLWYISPTGAKVLMRSMGFPVRRCEVPLIVHRANPECDGEVDLPTFRTIMEERYANLDPEEETRKAFKLFDKEGLGKITLENLRCVSKELGENLADRELEAMIDEFDKNLDGSVTLDEFVNIMNEQRKLES